jgi:hypothetical protein
LEPEAALSVGWNRIERAQAAKRTPLTTTKLQLEDQVRSFVVTTL